MNTTGCSADMSSSLPSHSLEIRPSALPFIWATVACAFAVLLLSAAGTRGAEIKQMTDIGAVSGYTRSENGITLQCAGNSQVRISVLAPDLIRVRASFGKSIPLQDHSWAIARIVWEPVQWTVTENPEQILITTSEVVVVVRRSPLLIEFRDAISRRVINSDDLPMRFDPVGTGIAATKKLGADEHFYGLGEKAAPLNKRRQKFTMWNTDNAFYVEGTDPIYQSIPFYIGLENGAAYGIFFDNSYRTNFDFGQESQLYASFAADGGEMNYYFFPGPWHKKSASPLRGTHRIYAHAAYLVAWQPTKPI